MNITNADDRKKPYKDLIAIIENTIDDGEKVLKAWTSYTAASLKDHALLAHLTHKLQPFLPIARQVIYQTRRQVLTGESVPAQEKIVSIFKEHTNIIRKDCRNTYYGYKLCIMGGSSNLILHCVVLEGNPTDSELTGMMWTGKRTFMVTPPFEDGI